MAKLPILMYHNVCLDAANSKGLTISKDKLESHFNVLKSEGYTPLHFSDIQALKLATEIPKKPIIITFDDVYEKQFEWAYPLLKQYNMKASFFIPFSYVGGYDHWNDGKHKIMSIEQLKALDNNVVELGLHSFMHRPYDRMTLEEIESDFEKCQAFIQKHQLNVKNILAYPYGKFPRNSTEKIQFFNLLSKQNMAYGLRIGNRLNNLPLKSNYELNRLDIKGEMSLVAFRRKITLGKRPILDFFATA